jgi:hypothetical protein
MAFSRSDVLCQFVILVGPSECLRAALAHRNASTTDKFSSLSFDSSLRRTTRLSYDRHSRLLHVIPKIREAERQYLELELRFFLRLPPLLLQSEI